MMRTRIRPCWAFITTGAILAAACSDERATAPPDGSSLAVAPADADAHGVVRGRVVGRLENGTGTEPVPGAEVAVYYMEPDPDAPPDTLVYRRRLVGTVLTSADGRFELTKVPEGAYVLLVHPPAGSPYFAGGEWAVTSPGTGVIDVTIVLRRPTVSDLRGEVRGWLAADTSNTGTEAVPGAEVRVFVLERGSNDAGSYDRRLVGTAVTDASGRFALEDLDEGEFFQWSLDVTAPAGSPYRGVENQIVVSSGTGVTEVSIPLLRR